MKRKKYWEMTTEELAEATKEFDEEFVAEKARLLSDAEWKQFQKLKRGRGRPRNGQGFKRISVSLERGLLKRATAMAKMRHITRSKLFAEVLAKAMALEEGSKK